MAARPLVVKRQYGSVLSSGIELDWVPNKQSQPATGSRGKGNAGADKWGRWNRRVRSVALQTSAGAEPWAVSHKLHGFQSL